MKDQSHCRKSTQSTQSGPLCPMRSFAALNPGNVPCHAKEPLAPCLANRWCMNHPQVGIPTPVLLPPYSHPTRFLLQSYWCPTRPLPSVTSRKPPKTRQFLELRITKKRIRSNVPRYAPEVGGQMRKSDRKMVDRKMRNRNMRCNDGRLFKAHCSWLGALALRAPLLAIRATPTLVRKPATCPKYKT